MSKHSHGRKPKAKRVLSDDPGTRIHDVRRAYKRPHGGSWQERTEDEEVEELEDFDDLADIEDSELDVIEDFIGPDEEERS